MEILKFFTVGIIVLGALAVLMGGAFPFRKCTKCGRRKTLLWTSNSADSSYPNDCIHIMRHFRCWGCGHEEDDEVGRIGNRPDGA